MATTRTYLPYLLLVIGILFGICLAWRTKATKDNAIVLKALACTCPDYSVVQGSWKIESSLLDTVVNLNKNEVYVTGMKNPWNEDYSAMYDLMLAEGEVVGIDRVNEGSPWNPVINVKRWEHLGSSLSLSYGILKWGALLFTALALWMLWAKRIGNR